MALSILTRRNTGLIKRAQDATVTARATKAREFIENRLQVPIHTFAGDSTYLEVGSKKVWAAFLACHITANTLLSSEFKIESARKGSGGTRLSQEVGGLQDLLDTPNPYDSWEDMLYLWTFHMKLTGKAYWLKDEMNAKGQPLAVYPLYPQFVSIVPHPTEKISHFEYKVNGRTIRYEKEEIIFFNRPHPMNALRGIGDVEAGEALFSQHIDRDLYREKVFEQGAVPSGILVRKEEPGSQDEWDALKQGWKSKYGGKKNVGKTAFLSGEWQYLRMGMTSTDMDELENAKLTVNQIFALMGVPLSVANVEKSANYATARQDEINFRKYSIVPMLDMLCGKLNMAGQLIRNFNEAWELGYELSGLVDVEQIYKDWSGFVELGAMTPNELREMAGLEKSPNPFADQLFVKNSLLPIELAGVADVTPEPAPPKT